MSSRYKDLEPGMGRRLIAAFGGGLIVVGTVLPWTRYELSAGEALAGTTAGIAGAPGIAVLLAGLAVVVVALFVNSDALTATAMGIAAGGVLATTMAVWLDPTSFAPGVDLATAVFYESAYGLWLTILGGLLACYEALALASVADGPN